MLTPLARKLAAVAPLLSAPSPQPLRWVGRWLLVLILASTSSNLAGYFAIIGGAAVLVGAVITIASFTPSYKKNEWDDQVGKIGYLVGTVGVAGLFAASTIELTTGNAPLREVEAICAAVVAATVVVVFALPIAKGRKERRGKGRRR